MSSVVTLSVGRNSQSNSVSSATVLFPSVRQDLTTAISEVTTLVPTPASTDSSVTSSSSSPSSSSNGDTAKIVGGVIGGIALGVLLAIAVFICLRRRRVVAVRPGGRIIDLEMRDESLPSYESKDQTRNDRILSWISRTNWHSRSGDANPSVAGDTASLSPPEYGHRRSHSRGETASPSPSYVSQQSSTLGGPGGVGYGDGRYPSPAFMRQAQVRAPSPLTPVPLHLGTQANPTTPRPLGTVVSGWAPPTPRPRIIANA